MELRHITNTKRILNLYAGIGGNAKPWSRMEVTAIEIHPEIAGQYQRNYPNHEVFEVDALSFLEAQYQNYDFIWASPPCDEWSSLTTHWTRHKVTPKMRTFDLYKIIDFCQRFVQVPLPIKWMRHKTDKDVRKIETDAESIL